MRTVAVRLYVAAPLGPDATVALDAEQAHYVTGVMRLKAGASLRVFNGTDGEWTATLAATAKKAATLTIGARLRDQDRLPDLTLAFAPPKGPRLAALVEKATELGVTALAPVIAARSVVRNVNPARLRAIATEAAEQCGRLSLPEIAPAVPLARFLRAWPADRRLVFCDESGGGAPLAQLALLAPGERIGILVGPEGGFAEDERAAIRRTPGAAAASLGPRILRVDTAAIGALAVWQAIAGDWQS
jgi:16S rRNA (uracil1498-N3)-methyltransferase